MKLAIKLNSVKVWIIRLLPLWLAVSLLAWVWKKGFWEGELIRQMFSGWGWFWGLVIHGMILMLASVRFWLLSRGLINFSQAILSTFMGVFWGFAVPLGGLGVDAFRVGIIRRWGQRSLKWIVVAAALDRLVGLWSLSFFVMWGLYNSDSLRQILGGWGYLVLIFFLLAGLIAVGAFKLAHPELSWSQLWSFYRRRWFYILGVSSLSQLASISFFLIIGQMVLSLPRIAITELMIFVPLGFLLMALPISPQGLGVGQLSFYWIFEKFLNLPGHVGVALVTGYQLFHFLVGLMVTVGYQVTRLTGISR